jgi:hypothetical protein
MPDPADIDLDQTDRVAELAAVPAGDRDAAWLAEFFAAVPTAALRVPAEEMMRGPDGFPYLLMFVPPKDVDFAGVSLRVVLDTCLEKGIGIAVYPETQDKPVFVFTYGQLWSYKSTGKFDARDLGAGRAVPSIPPPVGLGGNGGGGGGGGGGNEVMVGSPSAQYFPPFARSIVRQYLKLNGVDTPKVALVADAAGKRPQALVFNLYRDDFKNDDHLREVLTRLAWYFPPHYGVQPLMTRGTRVDELMEDV